MRDMTNFDIDRIWLTPKNGDRFEAINQADNTPFAIISLGSTEDVVQAVAAARRARTAE